MINTASHFTSTGSININGGSLVLNGNSLTTLSVNGTGARSDWKDAFVSFATSNTGTFNGIVAGNGGTANLTLSGAALTNIGSFSSGGAGDAAINVNSSTLSIIDNGTAGTGSADFGANTSVNVNAGTLYIQSSGTFESGSSLSVTSSGTLIMGSGGTVAFNGGAGTFGNSSPTTLSPGSALRRRWRHRHNRFWHQLRRSNSTIRVNAGGGHCALITTGTSFNDTSNWGQSLGDTAVVNFVSGGVGTFGGRVSMSTAGGAATLNLNGGGISTQFLFTGGSSGNALISITDGGSLNAGVATLNNNTSVTLNYTSAAGTFNATALGLSGNVQIQCGSTGFANADIHAGSVSLSGTSKIDLGNQGLILSTDPFGQLRIAIVAAYNNGSWNGSSGITSALAVADATANAAHKRGVGFAQAGSIGLTSFRGASVGPSDFVAGVTYYGDANLDGKVNALDFNALATNFGKFGTLWSGGDFNFDNKVDTSDFTMLAANFGASRCRHRLWERSCPSQR